MQRMNSEQADSLWRRVCIELRNKLSSTTINTFFDTAVGISLAADKLVIRVSGEVARSTLVKNHLRDIEAVLFEIRGENCECIILTERDEAEYFTPDPPVQEETSPPDTAAPGDVDKAFLATTSRYTFDNFVVGGSNRFAHAAALSVAEGSAHNYNPLFIYGGSGLGKTHLLSAIAGFSAKRHPNLKIVYTRGEDFTNELIEVIREGRIREQGLKAFREKYRTADLLLIDDIQFIAGKDSTQEEFFNIFNNLYGSDHQMVMTSDRPPKDMSRLEERLRTRFEWGLIADIQPPDLEMRTAIIRNKSRALGMELSTPVVNFIAENITSNVRQLEGVVKKLQAFAVLLNDTITVDVAAKAISDVFTENPIPTPEVIIEATERFYGLESGTLSSKKKDNQTAQARHIAAYLIREMTKLSFPEIGRAFGRHHSTIIHSVEQISDERRSDPKLDNDIKDLMFNITNKQ